MANNNPKGKIIIGFLFVVSLFVLAYYLLKDNLGFLFVDKTRNEFVEGKNVQYRFAYTGTGDKTNIISLNKGSALFQCYHEGKGSFYAELTTSSGKLVKVLADTKGNFENTFEVEIPETDAYIVNIRTTGTWGLDFK